ncbi:hypothetical protein SLT36_30645 (plasmid) [Aminobacter sp. BA135]|uniref:hypothetical protein n=1 Tax=Aminobacter sp. BA135 TaxID=537596 RepID=UPI003D794F88
MSAPYALLFFEQVVRCCPAFERSKEFALGADIVVHILPRIDCRGLQYIPKLLY